MNLRTLEPGSKFVRAETRPAFTAMPGAFSEVFAAQAGGKDGSDQCPVLEDYWTWRAQDYWRNVSEGVFSGDLTLPLFCRLLAFNVLLMLKHISFMKFNIEVGQEEKHNVEFNFHQLTGILEIRVDGQVVLQSQRLINEPVCETYQFVVGEQEKTDVMIEKCRRPLFGHRRRVWINNRLAQVAQTAF